MSILLLSFYSQETQKMNYKRYLDKNLIGKIQQEINVDSTIFETTYLGILKVNNNKYHILSQFYTVKMANGRRGNSKVFFTNAEGEIERVYHLDMPDELPTSIENNRLKLRDLLFENYTEELPNLLCVPHSGCYEWENE